MYTRSELAVRTGVGLAALRFYEEQGVLAPPARGANNYRLYDDEAVQRLRFLRLAQRCGFSLKEIREVFGLLAEGPGCEVGSDDILDRKLAEIRARQAELAQMAGLLEGTKRALKDQDCGNLSAYLDLVDLP